MIMKQAIIAFLMLLPSISQAQQLTKGYRGMADVGYCYYISQTAPSTIEITTSHGYQFNPYIYLGAGFGFNLTGECEWGDVMGKPYHKRESKVDIPVFFNVRANFTKTKVSPFADARIGAYVNNDGNIYANLALGCRYALSDNLGLSIAIGYELRKVTIQQLNISGGTKLSNYKTEYFYTDRPNENVDGFVFKVGVDF